MNSMKMESVNILPPERAIERSKWLGLFRALERGQHVLSRRCDDLAEHGVYRVLSAMTSGYLTVREGDREFTTGSLEEMSTGALINVVDRRVYGCIASNGVLGAAEAYMEGYWTTPDLVAVVQFMVRNIDALQSFNVKRSSLGKLLLTLLSRINRNSISGSKSNIASHYDLGNDFFALFLDPTMMYSAAIFEESGVSLEKASLAKLDRICRKLELKPDDHLLEIGTGWGGMAIYAAQHYGCRVTTTTISQEQYEYTCRKVQQLGLQGQVTVLCKDYRELEGQYDKLVSIEMIEAVGYEYYENYFQQCSKLLTADGLMMIQAITIPEQRFEQARRTVDFIKRYIFPGGCLPSISVIGQQLAEHTDMNILDVMDMTNDYARTLSHWRESFEEAMPTVKSMGFDERFIRMWDYYLCYCEGGFAERVIGTSQLLMAKPGYRSSP